MPFEWLPADEAAEALGVDMKTLQAWVDDGRAPSREQNGKVQVLIEYDEEDGTDPATDDAPDVESTSTGHVDVDDEPTVDDAPRTEVIHARELQMAAGCVAAWQRLAEHADHELARTRKISIASWSLVAVLAVTGTVGLWYGTRSVSDSQASTTLVRGELTQAQLDAEARLKRVTDLEAQVARLTDELTTRQKQLTEAMTRAAESQARVEQLTETNAMLKRVGDERGVDHTSLVTALRATIDQQKQRITQLDSELEQTRTDLVDTRKRLSETTEALLAAERDRTQARQSALDAQMKQVAAEKALAAAEQRATASQAERAALETALADAKAERERVKEQLDRESKEHAEAKSTLSQLESRVKALEADLKAARETGKAPAGATPTATADAGQ